MVGSVLLAGQWWWPWRGHTPSQSSLQSAEVLVPPASSSLGKLPLGQAGGEWSSSAAALSLPPFWGLPRSAPALPSSALERLSSPQCLFLLWCMAPVSWNGSQVLYQNVIRPCFLRHHQTVDNVLGNLSTKALDAASSVTREGNVGPPVPAILLRVRGRWFSPEHSPAPLGCGQLSF